MTASYTTALKIDKNTVPIILEVVKMAAPTFEKQNWFVNLS